MSLRVVAVIVLRTTLALAMVVMLVGTGFVLSWRE